MSSSTQRPRRDTLARNVPSSAKPKLLHRRTERSLINWSLSIKATDQLQVIVSLSNHPYSAGSVLNSTWYSAPCLVDANGDDVLDVAHC